MHFKKWTFFLVWLVIFMPVLCEAKTNGGVYAGVVKAIDSLRSITIGKGLSIWSVDATRAILLRDDGTKLPFADIQPGDFLSVRGKMIWTTINATQVVDQTRHAKKYVLNGTIGALGKNSFTLESKAGEKNKISVSDATNIVKRGKNVKFSVLRAGATVKVTATKENGTKLFSALAVQIIKD